MINCSLVNKLNAGNGNCNKRTTHIPDDGNCTLNCPNCGELIKDEYALFCPYCANRLSVAKKRSGFQITAAVLTIVGACLSVSAGLLGLVPFMSTFGRFSFFATYAYFLAMGVFNIFSFAFGLLSGLFILRRKHFWWSIIGTSLVLASGFATIVSFGASGVGGIIVGLVFGIPVVILALLGLVFAAVSRNEFV
jgi:hypothetical protein